MMNDEYGLQAAVTGEKLALRGTEISARISGLLAETRVVQKYVNDTGTNLELTYTFPLPMSGTLLSFFVSIGGKRFEGEVVPRTKAEVEYEKAIGADNSPGYVQRHARQRDAR